MKHHIGIDARAWRSESGGLGRYSRNLVKELLALDPENHYTVIITAADEPEFTLKAPNLSVLSVDIPYYSVAEQVKLPGILQSQHFDLVHFTHFTHPIAYRQPFVVTVHDLIMHLFPTGAQTKSLTRKFGYRWVMNDTKRAGKIIVPSESTKKDLVHMLRFPNRKIVVTPEGSETGLFRPHTEAEIAAIKKKLKLPDQFIVFVSRWEKYKGLIALLEAFEMLSKQYPHLGLVITGKPYHQSPEIADMVRARQMSGYNIITPGFVSDPDLAALYSAASVYVHPSWYEGFGIMILEAFASGVPVVTSNTSSLPEVVGKAGLLVDPRDPQDIREKIASILESPKLALELRAKGLERVKDFSWKKMAEQTLAVYKSLLKKA